MGDLNAHTLMGVLYNVIVTHQKSFTAHLSVAIPPGLALDATPDSRMSQSRYPTLFPSLRTPLASSS